MKFLKSLFGIDDKKQSASPAAANQSNTRTSTKTKTETLPASKQILALDGKSDEELIEHFGNPQFTRSIVLKTLAAQITEATVNSAEQDLMLEVAGYARNDSSIELFNRRFASSDLPFLTEQLQNGPDRSKGFIAQLIAPKLHDIADLQTLAEMIKGRDKNAYRTLKERIEQVKAGQAVEHEKAEKIALLFKNVKALGERPVDKEFRARFSYLSTQVRDFAPSLSADQSATLEAQLDACAGLIQTEEEAIEKYKQEQAQVERADSERQKLLVALAAESAHLIEFDTPEAVAESESRVQDLIEQWKHLDAKKKSPEQQLEQWQHHLHAIAQLHEQVTEHGDLATQFEQAQRAHEEHAQASANSITGNGHASSKSSDVEESENSSSASTSQLASDSVIQTLAESFSLIDSELTRRYPLLAKIGSWLDDNAETHAKTVRPQKNKKASQDLRSFNDLLKKGFSAARGGRVSQAFGIKRKLDEMVVKLVDTPESLQERLDELNGEIEKLDDWQDSIIEPKKEALIADMEKLIDQEMTVEARHTRIKRLQRDWRGLRQRPSELSDSLWERFKKASDAAYEPCKQHYGELDKEREANLTKRYGLIDQLKVYSEQYDWSNAVWKDVEQTLRTAKNEFHAIKPIAREAKRDVEASFDNAIAPVKAKMDEAYEKAKSSKNQLVEQAKKLLEQKELSIAIDQAKNLQNKWREAGRTWVRADRELWTAFKENIDQVFARLDEKREAENAEKNEELKKAEEIHEKLREILAQEGDELLRLRSQKETLLSQLAEVGELPFKKEKATLRAVEETSSAIDKKFDNTVRSQAKSNVLDLLQIKAKVAREEIEQGDAKEKIKSLSTLPEGMKSKAVKALDSDSASFDANLICIRAEIATGEATPAADSQRRSDYQMELLQKGFGQRETEQTKELDGLIVEWLECTDITPALDTRFRDLVEKHY